ncbi:MULTISPECIES: hypothetical protein [Kocuria]|uniref:hypothetical protein n=1 Tax=Kocuria TaxID=57493 RepID=UPI000F544BE9|nr:MULTISPECIES: hypothetical protein [Kocuria]MXN61495.1 hypothetical protein [Bacillus sp. BGMRC0062]WIW68378.1 hypothetical protein P8S73_00370 [Kocuria sp. ChxB]MCT1546063.1 hypothetical protein [Kocuria rhizophila]MCT2172501.1 hypothetical protein [Kocuria rhizophila]MDA4828878.1 hypothetical protein [Kocuria rhizophila]
MRNQEHPAQDPQASQLEAGRALWLGGRNLADGTYGGGLPILTGGELGTLTKVGAIVTEALHAVSVRPLWRALRWSHGPLRRHPSLVSRGARVTCHGPGPRTVVVASP